MARRRARGTPYLAESTLARELYPRFGLDNAARANSTAGHNRRRARLGSVGPQEIMPGGVRADYNIDWGAGKTVPSDKVKDGYGWDQLSGKPADLVRKQNLKFNLRHFIKPGAFL